MKHTFRATFHPTSISEFTLKVIITELFNTENFIVHEGFTVDYLNEFYKNFNFSIIIDIVDFINMVRFDPVFPCKNTIALIDKAYGEMPIIMKDSLQNEFLQNWKTPNIKNYHTFIQMCVNNYNKSRFFTDKLERIIFDTWRHIDRDVFKEQLSKVKFDDFYEELKRLEFDFVELMLL